MTVKKPSTADQVRSSVVRRPEGAAAAARAASTFQGGDAASASGPKTDSKLATLQLDAGYHRSLRQRALDEDTGVADLVRTAITACMQNPDKLAAASLPYRRVLPAEPSRTTALIPLDQYRDLKQLGLTHSTTVQALITAALTTVYPPQ